MTSSIIGLIVLFFVSLASNAQALNVSKARYPMRAEQYFVVLDVTASPKHRRVFVLDKPPRLMIDLYNTAVNSDLSQPPRLHPLFANLKVVHKNNTDIRLVMSLKKPVTDKHFSLITHQYPQQFVIELKELIQAMSPAKPADAALSEKSTQSRQTPAYLTVAKSQSGLLDSREKIVIAIDAGHGGSDPGARGALGTEEKTITFAIANKLAQLINKEPNMKAIMVRKGDELMGLKTRTDLARKANANLFVSIHADAYPDPTIRGASVFTLSRKGASSEAARWLADSENSADAKLGGVELDDIENDVKSVLMDVSQNTSQQASIKVAKAILKNFHEICGLHRSEVQNAGFLVLKSPDMPSILVETAFISNPEEEKNLLSNRYQSQMALAIFKGIQEFFGE